MSIILLMIGIKGIVVLNSLVFKNVFKNGLVNTYHTNVGWLDKKVRRKIHNKPIPRQRHRLGDSLYLPGLETSKLLKFERMIYETSDYNLSNENIALLVYNFSKYNMMSPKKFEIMYPMLRRFKGEFSQRSIFGCLCAAIKENNQPFFKFFINEANNSHQTFTADESLELLKIMTRNTVWTQQQKFDLWNRYLKEPFVAFMSSEYADRNGKRTVEILKALEQFGELDEKIWNPTIKLLHNQKGRARIAIYQLLGPYTERFQEAAAIVAAIKQQFEASSEMRWRYNIEERRYYTNVEMAAKCDEGGQLNPPYKTLLEPALVPEMIQKFQILQSKGSLMQEAQIQEQKAKSLSYVLYDKYMKQKGANFTLTEQDYEDLFGMTDKEVKQFFEQSNQFNDEEEGQGEEGEEGAEQGQPEGQQ